MSAKIIVADDSATIQKVVKITLAEEPFEIIEALGEHELFAALRSSPVDLVLLDFNLSEQKSGYQLAEEITKQYSKTSVMAMLGTFDSVDEQQLKKSGVKDKIVKPFDSQKFVEKCHSLVEVSEEEIAFEEESEEEEVVFEEVPEKEEVAFAEGSEEEEVGDDWVMEGPDNSGPVPVEDLLEHEDKNYQELEEEIDSWKGEVPGVIGEDEDERVLAPPVIDQEAEPIKEKNEDFDLDSTSTFRLEDIDEEFAQKTPDEEDLEYPETIAMYQPGPKKMPTTGLVSLDELAPEEEDFDEDEEATDPEINLEPNLELEREVEKEVSPEEFWAVDDEGLELQNGDEDSEVEEEKVDISDENVDYNKLVDALKEKLSPFIENVIKDICTKSVEKISWEVIPDLAENLIKKELKEISQNIDS